MLTSMFELYPISTIYSVEFFAWLCLWVKQHWVGTLYQMISEPVSVVHVGIFHWAVIVHLALWMWINSGIYVLARIRIMTVVADCKIFRVLLKKWGFRCETRFIITDFLSYLNSTTTSIFSENFNSFRT